MSPADDGGERWEFVNRSRHVIIAPVATIDVAVRHAQAYVIQEGMSAAIPVHTEPLGRMMDDQAMVISGRMNATDKILQAVLAEERRLREEDKVKHSQEMEKERKRISDATASAALTRARD